MENASSANMAILQHPSSTLSQPGIVSGRPNPPQPELFSLLRRADNLPHRGLVRVIRRDLWKTHSFTHTHTHKDTCSYHIPIFFKWYVVEKIIVKRVIRSNLESSVCEPNVMKESPKGNS